MKKRHFITLLLLFFAAQSQAFGQTYTLSSDVYEANEGDGAASLVVTRDASAAAGTVRVGVFPYGFNNAEVGVDLLPGATLVDGLTFINVNFAAGQSTANVSIALVNDTAVEGPEVFGVVLRRSNSQGRIGLLGTALITVQDDEALSTAAPTLIPEPRPVLEGQILCIFGTPFDDDLFCDRILTTEFSPFPLFVPTADDMLSPELIVLGGLGDDTFTCFAGEPNPLPIFFDGEQGFDNQMFLTIDSVRDTNTATFCEGEMTLVSQRAAGTVGGVSYPAGTFTAEAVNTQVIEVALQVGGGFGDGEDVAFLKDSPGNDCLFAKPDDVRLYAANGSYDNSAIGFDRAVVYGSTGFDKATLKGSLADEEFESKPTFSRLRGNRPNPFGNGLDNTRYDNYVAGFDCVTADGCGGQDIAYISGSNQQEEYVGTPTSGALTRDLNCQRALDFDDVVVFGGGGCDLATLFDSAGDDVFVGRRENSAMFDTGRSYSHTLKNFSDIEAISDAGGTDEAQLYDTHGSDTITAEPRVATLITAKKFTAIADGFNRVLAISREGGNDTIDQSPGLWYSLQRFGPWK